MLAAAVLHVSSASVCVSPLALARVVALATVGGNCCSSSGSVWIMIVCVVRDRAHGEATRTIIWWCEPAVVPFSWATSCWIHDCAVNIFSPIYLRWNIIKAMPRVFGKSCWWCHMYRKLCPRKVSKKRSCDHHIQLSWSSVKKQWALTASYEHFDARKFWFVFMPDVLFARLLSIRADGSGSWADHIYNEFLLTAIDFLASAGEAQ